MKSLLSKRRMRLTAAVVAASAAVLAAPAVAWAPWPFVPPDPDKPIPGQRASGPCLRAGAGPVCAKAPRKNAKARAKKVKVKPKGSPVVNPQR